MRKLLLCLVLLLPLVSGLAFVQNQPGDIKHSVRVGNYIPTSASCNITVFAPNNTILVDFLSMTDQGNYFNYTLTANNLASSGEYNYDITCSEGGLNATNSYTFFVNPAGIEPSEQRTNAITRSVYFIFGIAILLFIGFLYFNSMPIKATAFLMSLLFMLMGVNTIFIALQDEVINPSLAGFFEAFTAISFYIYYFIFFLVGAVWLVTTINTIVFKQNQDKMNRFGTGV